MSDFAIDGPAVISFSGGRTSGYMLRRVLDEGIRNDVHVLFANTGKERPETLDFVHACAERWAVEIHWVERDPLSGGMRETNYRAASRAGEPFEALITDRHGPPNPIARFCTQELKVRPFRDWMTGRGYEHWVNVIGIRADEPRRVARIRDQDLRQRWETAIPLASAGVTVQDVNRFWQGQAFDLELRQIEGNCDCCFLKSHDKLKNIVRDRPDLAEWWARQEERTGVSFRNDRPSYRSMLAQGDLFLGFDDEQIECFCHD